MSKSGRENLRFWYILVRIAHKMIQPLGLRWIWIHVQSTFLSTLEWEEGLILPFKQVDLEIAKISRFLISEVWQWEENRTQFKAKPPHFRLALMNNITLSIVPSSPYPPLLTWQRCALQQQRPRSSEQYGVATPGSRVSLLPLVLIC